MDSPLFDGLDKILSDDRMMSKIKALAAEMSGGAAASGAENEPPKPPLPQVTKSKVGGYCAILAAVRPYLDDGRQKRVDKVINVLRLADTAKMFIGM